MSKEIKNTRLLIMKKYTDAIVLGIPWRTTPILICIFPNFVLKYGISLIIHYQDITILIFTIKPEFTLYVIYFASMAKYI